jgi:hypothetical protein
MKTTAQELELILHVTRVVPNQQYDTHSSLRKGMTPINKGQDFSYTIHILAVEVAESNDSDRMSQIVLVAGVILPL